MESAPCSSGTLQGQHVETVDVETCSRSTRHKKIMTIKIKANTNNKSGKQKPAQILKLCQKGPGLKNRKQQTGTNKKYKTKNKEEIKKLNRSPIPIPDPKKGALKDKAPKYRITGKQKDMLTGKDKRPKKVKKSKKVKESKKPPITPKLPCKPVLRFKPQRGHTSLMLMAATSLVAATLLPTLSCRLSASRSIQVR